LLILGVSGEAILKPSPKRQTVAVVLGGVLLLGGVIVYFATLPVGPDVAVTKPEPAPPTPTPPPPVPVAETRLTWAPKRPGPDPYGTQTECWARDDDKEEFFGNEPCPYLGPRPDPGQPQRNACWPNDNRKDGKSIELCLNGFGDTYEQARAERARRIAAAKANRLELEQAATTKAAQIRRCTELAAQFVSDAVNQSKSVADRWIREARDGTCLSIAKSEMCAEVLATAKSLEPVTGNTGQVYIDSIIKRRYCG